MREHGGWENFKMIFIQKYPCESKREAAAREQELMDELRANINTYRAFGRDVEDRKDKLSSRFECECGIAVQCRNKARHFRTKLHQTNSITRHAS